MTTGSDNEYNVYMHAKPLPDIFGNNITTLFVGYNPGLESAARKHHYANRSNRFWKLLHESGDRQTRSSDDITRQECLEGCRSLEKTIIALRPCIVCYVGIGVYKAFSAYIAQSRDRTVSRSAGNTGTRIATGMQNEQLTEGVIDYVCYNPSGRNTVPYLTQLECLIGLKDLISSLSTIKEVTAAIIMKDSRALIAQRGDGESMAGKWEFPGGKIKPGESPEECLKREIMEELDLTVTVNERFGVSICKYGKTLIRLDAYLCSPTSGEPTLSVHKDIAWIDGSEPDGKYDFASADIQLVKKLYRTYLTPS